MIFLGNVFDVFRTNFAKLIIISGIIRNKVKNQKNI